MSTNLNKLSIKELKELTKGIEIIGTGKNGNIIKKDLINALKNNPKKKTSKKKSSHRRSKKETSSKTRKIVYNFYAEYVYDNIVKMLKHYKINLKGETSKKIEKNNYIYNFEIEHKNIKYIIKLTINLDENSYILIEIFKQTNKIFSEKYMILPFYDDDEMNIDNLLETIEENVIDNVFI